MLVHVCATGCVRGDLPSMMPFWMISRYVSSLSSLASSTVRKSPLAVLRRRTGYPIGKCKDALQRHNNDVGLAERWMKKQALKEGWAKAEQLAERATRQGLIGAVARENRAAIVEVR